MRQCLHDAGSTVVVEARYAGTYKPYRYGFVIEPAQPFPLPDDPLLAAHAKALNDAGMSITQSLAAGVDLRHFERMQDVSTADRRPAAILFADLEASSPLARRLSTADYFNLARRLVRAADQCVVEAGGLVGRHLGDGVTAFFLAEVTALGDEVNEAARIEACASGGRALASKALVERLDRDDAQALDLEHINYTPLGELATATEKARRDAPAIAVCDV